MEFRLGKRIEQLINARGWDQKQLAERSGLHPTTIGLFLKGARTAPSIETVQKIAGAFGMTVSQFIEEEATRDDLAEYQTVARFAKGVGLTATDLMRLVDTLLTIHITMREAEAKKTE